MGLAVSNDCDVPSAATFRNCTFISSGGTRDVEVRRDWVSSDKPLLVVSEDEDGCPIRVDVVSAYEYDHEYEGLSGPGVKEEAPGSLCELRIEELYGEADFAGGADVPSPTPGSSPPLGHSDGPGWPSAWKAKHFLSAESPELGQIRRVRNLHVRMRFCTCCCRGPCNPLYACGHRQILTGLL